jgi:hypothetical protein
VKTVVHCKIVEYCPSCTETGGIIPEAPIQYYCMAGKCESPDRQCMFVRNGGVRP